jgi:hypothetical protein
VLLIEIAIYIPETVAPGKSPAINLGPNTNPVIIGVPITKIPGGTISLREASVEILIHSS